MNGSLMESHRIYSLSAENFIMCPVVPKVQLWRKCRVDQKRKKEREILYGISDFPAVDVKWFTNLGMHL